jgi:hypothetical protein
MDHAPDAARQFKKPAAYAIVLPGVMDFLGVIFGHLGKSFFAFSMNLVIV